MRDGHGEANGEGGRPQASVSSLVCDGKDAHHKLHGEEDLHGGRHSQTDAGLQLEEHKGRIRRFGRANPALMLASPSL